MQLITRRTALIGAASSLTLRRVKAAALARSFATLQADYVARSVGMFVNFSMPTFTGTHNTGYSASHFAPTSSVTAIAASWVAAAQALKANYIIMDTKARDGWCMWPTATTSYNISQSPWYTGGSGGDIVAEFVKQTRNAGLIPGLYLANEDANFGTGAGWKAFLQSQLTELLSNYGSISVLWFDEVEKVYGDSRPWASDAERQGYVKGLQPAIMALANDGQVSLATSDIVIYEDTGISSTTPGETVRNIFTALPYFFHTPPFPTPTLQSLANLQSYRSNAHSNNSTFLLDCAPDTTGLVPSDQLSLITSLGNS